MTTANDLFLIAIAAERPVGQGDLSLALAGAELIDLLGVGAAAVHDDHIEPGESPSPEDPLLAEAAGALVREAPFEPVEDWLWRRGESLSARYQAALETNGALTRKRGGRLSLGAERMEPSDPAAPRRATDRASTQPALAALASVVGADSGRAAAETDPDEGPVATVVAVVDDAVRELEAVRQRRSLEKAAFANVWRGPGGD